MPAGPKAAVDPSPLPFDCAAAGVERFAQFCEQYLIVPKGIGAGEPMRIRGWQVEMLRPFLDPDPRPVVGAIMAPRGVGKTGILAALGLYELFTGPDGNEIPIVAVDERMAGRLLLPAAQMVELHAELSTRAHVYRDHIAIPAKRSTLTALPAEAKRIEGLGTWTLALADELGEIDPDTWSTLVLGAGKLPGAMALGIGTPPNRDSSVLTDLRNSVRADPTDPTVAFKEFSADGFEHHPVDCLHCLELANPQLDDLLSRDRATAMLKHTTEGEYRRKRLCQVVTTNEHPFIKPGVWESLNTGQRVPDGAEVVIALDGSWGGKNADATALVIGTMTATPHFDVLDVWQADGSSDWRVPVLEVEDTIRQARSRFKVRELVADPFRWGRSLQVLAAEGLTVMEFPWSPARTTRATTDLFSAATAGKFTHSGDETLTRHVLSATVIESNGGLRIGKVSRRRNAAKIDCAAALLMCHSRCSWHATKPVKRNEAWSFA
ncbi:terminase [Mycobacterium intracellulare]|uniref:terminase n=1 Tax=Mycobacterium intracellulare TaxID=1767 RepID=UPI001CDA774A|nr:terminase [Mycobacterium intracellulare]MCA2255829.1 terminase [Mycobacterium intracellulare]